MLHDLIVIMNRFRATCTYNHGEREARVIWLGDAFGLVLVGLGLRLVKNLIQFEELVVVVQA